MRLWTYLAKDVCLENAPQALDRLSRGTSPILDTSPSALKKKRRQIGDLNAGSAVAMSNAGSLDDAWIRATGELLQMMGMNGPDQSGVRAAGLVENQQAPIAKSLAFAL